MIRHGAALLPPVENGVHNSAPWRPHRVRLIRHQKKTKHKNTTYNRETMLSYSTARAALVTGSPRHRYAMTRHLKTL